MTKRLLKQGRMGIALFTLGLAGFGLLHIQRSAAKGAELQVMCSDGLKPALEALTPQIEKAIGRKIKPHFDSSNSLKRQIEAGDAFDAVLVTTGPLDDLIKEGKVTAASRAEIARAGMGVGVRAGTAKPDISTPEDMKRTLLAAKSLTFNPTGASAAYIDKMLDTLGIADKVKPKFMTDAEAGRPQMNVAEGKTELVISLIPEIKFFKGVDFVGPLPGNLQSYINFGGGVAAGTKNSEAAGKLIAFLTSPAAATALKAKELEPR